MGAASKALAGKSDGKVFRKWLKAIELDMKERRVEICSFF